MILLTTNHKVGDIVYVVVDCVRRGTVQQVNFIEQNSSEEPFILNYEVLYDGFTFNTTIKSEVETVFGSPHGSPLPNVDGSPLTYGSPSPGSPVGSPGNPDQVVLNAVTITEKDTGGDIFTNKADALTAFGEKLA